MPLHRQSTSEGLSAVVPAENQRQPCTIYSFSHICSSIAKVKGRKISNAKNDGSLPHM